MCSRIVILLRDRLFDRSLLLLLLLLRLIALTHTLLILFLSVLSQQEEALPDSGIIWATFRFDTRTTTRMVPLTLNRNRRRQILITTATRRDVSLWYWLPILSRLSSKSPTESKRRGAMDSCIAIKSFPPFCRTYWCY